MPSLVRGSDVRDVDSTDDAVLVAAFLGGSNEAYNVLYQRHSGFVHRIANNILKNPDDADDIVQEVFLRVANKISALNKHASFKSWIQSIAHNLAINCLIKNNYHPHAHFEEERDGISYDPHVELNEMRKIVQASLETLRIQKRALYVRVLELFYLEDLTLLEMVPILTREEEKNKPIPIGTIKRRLNVARCLLEKILENRGITCLDD